MKDNPSDHELNEVLAEVAGVELHESEKGWMYWHNFGHGESLHIWNPLHDANQMELVKAKLRETGVSWNIDYWNHTKKTTVFLVNEDGKVSSDYQSTESELHAFALAVYAMAQSQKGMT